MIPETVRIFVCTEPVDMRKSFDTLAFAAKDLLKQDPKSGALFVFINKQKNRTKILWWDKTGYAMLCKRLHRAVFRVPKTDSPNEVGVLISPKELAMILEGIELSPGRHKIN